ncbi:hypothetical protein C8R44DRAFT_645333 [Mycena epipterygia]|nr:hypothetical protein C8R44DRAFT_645333 [Mycena epipterygia]
MSKKNLENALEILRKYDTVILVDDSGSMLEAGSKKGVTQALGALAETAQDYDTDGIDIHFLNEKKKALNIKSASQVRAIFDRVKPCGATPTGERLDQILRPHILRLQGAHIDPDGTPKDKKTEEVIKRINFIIITDGEASDDPKPVLIEAGKSLKAIPNLYLQVGIQFVQIGSDPAATRALRSLDDDLHKTEDIRDIVDTTPYSKLNPVTGDGLIKVLVGGINRRVDEQNQDKGKGTRSRILNFFTT